MAESSRRISDGSAHRRWHGGRPELRSAAVTPVVLIDADSTDQDPRAVNPELMRAAVSPIQPGPVFHRIRRVLDPAGNGVFESRHD